MTSSMRGLLIILAACILLGPVGCQMKTPVIFYKEAAESNPKKINAKIGVDMPNFSEAGKLIQMKSTNFVLIIPAYTFTADFPKRVDREFFVDLMHQYLKDSDMFSYAYSTPFDKNDVDLVMESDVRKFKYTNGSWGTTWSCIGQVIGIVPFVGLILTLIWIFAVPQEKFAVEMDMEVTLKTADGQLVGKYEASASGKDSIKMLAQPWGEYMWYKSVGRRIFLEVLDGIRGKMEEPAEAAKISAAAQDYRKRKGK